jgi:FkbM family methyltransferase
MEMEHIPKYNKPIQIIFENDMNTSVALNIMHPLFHEYAHRVHSEPLFRRIAAYLLTYVCSKGSTILDCGAWIGDNVIPWAKLMNEGKVVAFDPSPRNCQFIQYLMSLNQLTNVGICQIGLSDKDEIIYTDSDNLDHCSFTSHTSTNPKSNNVQAYALDTLFRQNIVSNVSFIHIDVEGMEWNVLRGAEQLLKTNRPILAYEVHLTTDKHIQDIKQYLSGLNYKVFLINEELPGCLKDCRNCLAIPDEINDSLNVAQMIVSQNLPIDVLIPQ